MGRVAHCAVVTGQSDLGFRVRQCCLDQCNRQCLPLRFSQPNGRLACLLVQGVSKAKWVIICVLSPIYICREVVNQINGLFNQLVNIVIMTGHRE